MFRRFSQQTQSGPRPAQQPSSSAPARGGGPGFPAGASPSASSSRRSVPAPSSTSSQHVAAPPDLSALSLGDTPLAPAPPYEAVPPLSSSSSAQAKPFAHVPAPAPAAAPARGPAGRAPPARRSSIEDRLAPLGKYDLVLVVDGAS